MRYDAESAAVGIPYPRPPDDGYAPAASNKDGLYDKE